MLKLPSVLTAVPALLSAADPVVFDAKTLVETQVNGAATQMYSILTVVAPVLAGVTVAVVLIKFGNKWIKKLGSAS